MSLLRVNIMKMIKDKKGLVLTEVLIALAMMAIGLIVVTTIYSNSVKTIQLSRSYLIGQNLGIEAIEAVISIRDSNWLKNPNRPECWLVPVPSGVACVPATGNIQAGKSYFIAMENGKWKMVENASALDLTSENDMESYRLYKDLTSASENYVDSLKAATLADDEKEASHFYRGVNVISRDDTSAELEIIIQWKIGQGVSTITRQSTIYNSH